MKVDVLLTIYECGIMTTKFELKMSRLSYDTFALVINFINQDWVPCHIIVGLFETPNELV